MWKFLKNKALEVTAGACFLSITEIIKCSANWKWCSTCC